MYNYLRKLHEFVKYSLIFKEKSIHLKKRKKKETVARFQKIT